MPQYNSQQVWQRVHAAQEAPSQDAGRILALIPDLQSCTQATTSHKELSRSFRSQASALRGIYTLLSGEKPSLGRVASPETTAKRSSAPGGHWGAHPTQAACPPAALRKCYAVQLRALSEYQALCAQAEYGPAFQALIPLAQENCLNILALLGS